MNNIINIFDGSKKTIETKGTYTYELNGSISEDLYSRKNFKVDLFDPNQTINNQDIFHTKIYNRTIIGKITNIEVGDKTTLTLTFGINVYNTFVNMPNNSLKGYNISESLESILVLNASSKDSVITVDTDLELDTLLRQSCRKSPKKITMSYVEDLDVSNEKLEIKIEDYVGEECNIKLSELMEVSEKYGTDSFNMCVLKDQDDPNNFKKFYKYEDGSVGEDITKAIKPIITSTVRKLQSTSVNKEYAESLFKEQEYNNEITFTVPIENGFNCLEYNDTFLGRVLNVYSSKFTEPFKSIISKYEIKDNFITITLGLSRTNFSEKLNKQKEVFR